MIGSADKIGTVSTMSAERAVRVRTNAGARHPHVGSLVFDVPNWRIYLVLGVLSGELIGRAEAVMTIMFTDEPGRLRHVRRDLRTEVNVLSCLKCETHAT